MKEIIEKAINILENNNLFFYINKETNSVTISNLNHLEQVNIDDMYIKITKNECLNILENKNTIIDSENISNELIKDLMFNNLNEDEFEYMNNFFVGKISLKKLFTECSQKYVEYIMIKMYGQMQMKIEYFQFEREDLEVGIGKWNDLNPKALFQLLSLFRDNPPKYNESYYESEKRFKEKILSFPSISKIKNYNWGEFFPTQEPPQQESLLSDDAVISYSIDLQHLQKIYKEGGGIQEAFKKKAITLQEILKRYFNMECMVSTGSKIKKNIIFIGEEKIEDKELFKYQITELINNLFENNDFNNTQAQVEEVLNNALIKYKKEKLYKKINAEVNVSEVKMEKNENKNKI